MSKPIIVERDGGLVRMTLNRPETKNALDLELCHQFMLEAMALHDDSTVRAVMIEGTGGTFCSGGDLRAFNGEGESLPPYVREMATYYHAGVSRLARLDAPVIASVEGAAAGAGFSLACACDIVLAAQSSRFTLAYTRLGLSIDGGSSHFVPRIVGVRRAIELALTNRILSAEEALEWGIVTQVLPDSELRAASDAMAISLASGPTRAFGAAKRLIYDTWNQPLETQLELETMAVSEMSSTADAREGIQAFVEKRPARFDGS